MADDVRKRAESLEELQDIRRRMNWDPDERDRSVARYEVRSGDVIITPYGKSGTTWLQQIFHTLRTRGDMDFDDISRVVPWIETSGMLGLDINAEQVASPRGFKSHLSRDNIPGGAKYIVSIRNPVDVAFSGFKFLEGWYFEPGSIPADEFILAGIEHGGYEKHLLSWWPHRNADDVLYLAFEHMKTDLEGTIEKVAEFVGVALDDELRAITLEHASFAFMQQHRDRFDDAMLRDLSEEEVLPAGSDSAKVRAGQVGVHELAPSTVEAIKRQWTECVEPVTGFADYESLLASLR